jgi:uncharacterized protein YjdB
MRITQILTWAVALISVGACGKTTTAPTSTLHVTVVPSSIAAASGETIRMTATVTDANGGAITPDSVRWISDDTTKVTVSSVGVLKTVRPTTTTIIRVTAFRLQARAEAQVPVAVN